MDQKAKAVKITDDSTCRRAKRPFNRMYTSTQLLKERLHFEVVGAKLGQMVKRVDLIYHVRS